MKTKTTKEKTMVDRGVDDDIDRDDLFAGFDPEEHDFMTMDGYDDCIIGIVERFGQPPIVCYDKGRILDRLMGDGMNYEEAVEFFEFNQIGAWVGDTTPCFLTANATSGGTGEEK